MRMWMRNIIEVDGGGYEELTQIRFESQVWQMTHFDCFCIPGGKQNQRSLDFFLLFSVTLFTNVLVTRVVCR